MEDDEYYAAIGKEYETGIRLRLGVPREEDTEEDDDNSEEAIKKYNERYCFPYSTPNGRFELPLTSCKEEQENYVKLKRKSIEDYQEQVRLRLFEQKQSEENQQKKKEEEDERIRQNDAIVGFKREQNPFFYDALLRRRQK
jgi:hypothetical protein